MLESTGELNQKTADTVSNAHEPPFARGVSFRSVGIRFDPHGHDILRDVSLEVRPGEMVALVGASGCGKSTVLRLIAGLLPPTQGTIADSSRPKPTANLLRSAAGQTGFVFQHPTLLPWRTALQNVTLPLELRGTPIEEAEKVARAACHLVKLTDADMPKLPRMLSGGMQMRVSMARALVTRPSMLLLDEPFAAIDDLLRHQLNDDLLHIWESHRWTGVFVTHHLAEAVYISQRVYVLAGTPGKLVGEIHIPFSYPRSHALRATPEFAKVVAEVDSVLRRTSS
jgi:NitT/TauT family transport system ATP-binding protein